MALPTDALVANSGQSQYGVVLQVQPGSYGKRVEIQVAAAASSDSTVPNTTTATRLTVVEPGITRYVHYLPSDGVRRHYRMRQILPGYTDGTLTDFVSSTPVLLSRWDTPVGDQITRLDDITTQQQVAGAIGVGGGGTGVVNPTSGVLLVGAGSNPMTELAPGADGGYVRSNGSAWVRSGLLSADLTGLLKVDGTGLGVNNATPAVLLHVGDETKLGTSPADASVGNFQSEYKTADAGVFHVSGLFYAEQTAATANSIQGVEGFTVTTHGSGVVALALGVAGNAQLAGAGTLTWARGVVGGASIDGAVGTIVNAAGLFAQSAAKASATITTAYGLYVDDQDDGGTNYAIFTNNGLVFIGGNLTKLGTSPADASIGRMDVRYVTNDTSVFHLGGLFYAEQTAATIHSIQGVEGFTLTTHGSGVVALAIGVAGNAQLAGAGTLTWARGVVGGASIDGAVGTITNAAGLFAQSAAKASATITTAYGLYVDDQDDGTTNYAIFTNNGLVHFQDNVGIGIPNPSRNLHVLAATGTIVQVETTGVNSTPDFVLKNDAQQWSIQCNGSNADALEFRDDTSGNVVVIDTSGNVGIANTAPPVLLQVGDETKLGTSPADASVGNFQSEYVTSDTGVFHISGLFYAEQSAATVHSIQGVEGFTLTTNAAGTVTLSIGVAGNAQHAGAGTVAFGRGVVGGVSMDGAVGTMTEGAALFAQSPAKASATITTAYGLYVDDQDDGTTNFAIFTNNGIVQFGDICITNASGTGRSGLRLPHGTAPTSPANGDIWTTTAGLFVRINGSTVGPLS